MSTRLISFLTDIENALIADEPSPDGGAWQNSRSVNYREGLARLTLAVKKASGSPDTLGTVFVQSFRLADGSTCVKAFLSWCGDDRRVAHSLYEKSGMDWVAESRRVAAVWLNGRPQAATAEAGQFAAAG